MFIILSSLRLRKWTNVWQSMYWYDMQSFLMSHFMIHLKKSSNFVFCWNFESEYHYLSSLHRINSEILLMIYLKCTIQPVCSFLCISNCGLAYKLLVSWVPCWNHDVNYAFVDLLMTVLCSKDSKLSWHHDRWYLLNLALSYWRRLVW